MTTATRKAKAEATASEAVPVTFAELAKGKAKERLEAYRGIV